MAHREEDGPFEWLRNLTRAVLEESAGMPGFDLGGDPTPRPGTIHAFSKDQLGDLPIGIVMLVLEVKGDMAVVAPMVLHPNFEPVEEGDLWLPSEVSPFSVLPETGAALVHAKWGVAVPVASLPDAILIILLDTLKPLDTERRSAPGISASRADWRSSWEQAAQRLRTS